MTLRASFYHVAHLPPVMVVDPNGFEPRSYSHRVWIEACGPPDIRCGLCSGGEQDSMGPTYICDECDEADREAQDREDMEWEADNG